MIDKYFYDAEQSIEKLQKAFEDYQNENFPNRSPEFFCLELNGEAGELANLEKKKWKGKEVSLELFEDEASDVLIALMNYSNARRIDLAKAVIKKLDSIEKKRNNLKLKGLDY